MTSPGDGVLDAARRWAAQDPDPETRGELESLVTAALGSPDALAEVRDRFEGRLSFGTAGLRGRLAAGPNRMNRVTVAHAAKGLADYLLSAAGPRPASIVIGYDGRKNSDVFARNTAEIMAGAGARAVVLPRLLPTPVLAFAVRHLGASAGVMVTASHNPPHDNGYKVYLGGADAGSQLVAPADAAIAALIDEAAEVPIAAYPRSADYEIAAESVIDAYVAATAQAAQLGGDGPAPAELEVVYTAMHGVGWETAARVFDAAGIRRPHTVAEQLQPDAAFPTLVFPNPEEPGAMDLSFAAAARVGAELVVANDPDADRLAIAIPDDSAEGYRRLGGNEVGILLGWMVAEDAHRRGLRGTLAASLVSSPALRAIALEYGLGFTETLTGFKWISRAEHLLFGYEEALGYLVNPQTVRDKDGISAAVAFLTLAGRLKAEGLTVADHLDRFARRFGYYASEQISIRVTHLERIAQTMARLRTQPPASLGGVAVNRVDDLAPGSGSLAPSDVLRFWMADGSRVVVRPSGTEPKLKIYLDASSATGTLEARRADATARVAHLGEALGKLLG